MNETLWGMPVVVNPDLDALRPTILLSARAGTVFSVKTELRVWIDGVEIEPLTDEAARLKMAEIFGKK